MPPTCSLRLNYSTRLTRPLRLPTVFKTTRVLSVQVQAESKTSHSSKASTTPSYITPKGATTNFQLAHLDNNLTVATSGSIEPAVSLIWSIPAGSRHEDSSSVGYSHYLRHAFFAGNSRESELSLTRTSELRGTNITIENGRESLTISAECPNEETGNVVKTISNMLQDFHLENYKMTDVEARVALDRELMNSNVEDILWNNAFEAAFRDKYGNSPISTFSGASTESITKFLNAAFNRSGHLVVGDGIDQLELSETVKGAFGRKITAASDTSPVFYGGERRVELDGDMNHVLVGFGTSGMANLEESLAMRILKNLVSSAGSLQYGSIRTHLPGLQALLAKEMLPITIKASNVSYSQGGLMGIHLSAPQSVGLRDVLETLCSDLKEFANGGVSPDVLGAAKTRAAFELVNSVESRFGRASYITQSILSSGKLPNLSEELKALHSMSSSEFKSFASKILLRRSVFVSAGNLRSLPYADELAF